jgi:hypothetical protein
LINYGVSVGHIQVRMAVMRDRGTFLPIGPGAHESASTAEIKEIVQRIVGGLDHGAVAIWAGLPYTPAASRDEILAVFTLAGQRRVPVQGLAGVDEAVGLARETKPHSTSCTEQHEHHGDARRSDDDRQKPRGLFQSARPLRARPAGAHVDGGDPSVTLLPARRLETRIPAMKMKGRLRAGADADVAIVDPATVIDRSTYREPSLPPRGIRSCGSTSPQTGFGRS